MIRLFLPVLGLLRIPVPYAIVFRRALPRLEGQVLGGDPSMPPTFLEGFWAFANPLRNAFLAKCWWDQRSLLDTGDTTVKYVVFGDDGATLPLRITTRYAAVLHGKENCRFSVVNEAGDEVPFTVLARGSGDEVLAAVLEHVERLDLAARSDIFRERLNDGLDILREYGPDDQDLFGPETVDRILADAFADAKNRLGEPLVTFV